MILRRKGYTLAPPDQGWADILADLPEGVDLKAKITRPRSIPQLGTYWGTLAWVLQNSEAMGREYATADDISDALQLAVGFVKRIKVYGAEIEVQVPRSKSFSECSQDQFNKYMTAAMDRLGEWIGYPPVDAYLEWMRGRRG